MEKESAGLRARSHPNRSILRKSCFSCFQARCAASYGPKVEQPNILLAEELGTEKPSTIRGYD
jgi:hypothetical protein